MSGGRLRMFDFSRRWLFVAAAFAVLVITARPSAAATSGPGRVDPTPNPGGAQVATIYFLGVSASGPTDAWSVGIDDVNSFRRPLVEHWDGLRWRAVRVPQPPGRQAWFHGVFQLGPTDVWAVGESSNADSQTEG